MNTAVPSLQGRLSAALLDPAIPIPEGISSWNASDPVRRFNVHRNNVVGSLVDALADTYPVVQALVGEEFFRAMAAMFVRAQPPASPCLATYGEGFPAFIAGFEPARAVPYLPDVARLEFVRLDAQHASDAPALDPLCVQRALGAGARTAELRFVPHPSLRLFASAFSAVSIWAAHQGEGGLEQVDVHVPETALVLRPAWDVVVIPCDPPTWRFVASAMLGKCLAECVLDAGGGDVTFDIARTLALLLGHDVITSIHFPEENSA